MSRTKLDGEEFDLNAVIDYVIDRRAAVGADISPNASTRNDCDGGATWQFRSCWISRHRPRARLAVIRFNRTRVPDGASSRSKKKDLVLMSEALEAVGDIYSINGFTSEGRRNVKFYVVKDFDEKYSDEVKRAHRRHQLIRIIRDSARRFVTRRRNLRSRMRERDLLIVLVRRPSLRSRLRRRALCTRGHARGFATGEESKASRRSALRSIASRRRSCGIFMARLATRSLTMCYRCRNDCREFIAG